jgi:hypothetical protein
MSLVVESGWLEQVDRGADNPPRYFPVTEPVRGAKARLWAVAPVIMMMMYMNEDLWYPWKHLWYPKGCWYHSLRTAVVEYSLVVQVLVPRLPADVILIFNLTCHQFHFEDHYSYKLSIILVPTLNPTCDAACPWVMMRPRNLSLLVAQIAQYT